ncbi:hypothetical protein [Halosolutus halophilus]|nr:hypothetical protein [Halosolutus halophilus]
MEAIEFATLTKDEVARLLEMAHRGVYDTDDMPSGGWASSKIWNENLEAQ